MLVKHGSHIRVDPCRLTLERTPITIQSTNESTQETQQHHQQKQNQERQHTAYDSDSEEETQQNSLTDTNPTYRTEDDMHDLNASLEQLSVTDEPLTGNTQLIMTIYLIERQN